MASKNFIRKTVKDIRQIARQNLTKNALNYYESGADYELTLSDNQQAYKRYKIRPRVLSSEAGGNVDLSVEAFGRKFKSPIFIAPTAMQKMAHPDGEIGTATASVVTGSCMGVSTLSTTSYENLSKAVPDAFLLMQLYVYKVRELSEELIRRAERVGFKAIILTVDTPTLGRRLADVKEKFKLPSHLKLENFEDVEKLGDVKDESGSGLMAYVSKNIENTLSWKDIDWLKSVTKLPLYLKGVVTREIAEQCLKHDVQGIIVSNHGGRQLDGSPATIDALGEVVRAVRGKLPVFVDGGIRNGSDVFKALAIGANGVFLGRPVLYGLAYNGGKGVEEVMDIMVKELKATMRATGCRNIKDISSSLVVHESQYGIHTQPAIKRNWALTPQAPICIEDIKESVRQKLKNKEEEFSSLLNEEEEIFYENAFMRYRFRPYRLRGIDSSDTNVQIFGSNYRMPLCLIDNDERSHSIAQKLLSKPTKPDDITNVPWFLNVDDLELFENKEKIQPCQKKGYKGILVQISSDLGKKVMSLREMTSLPVIARGVMCKEDALACLAEGIDGIMVCTETSTDSLTPIDVLGEITEIINAKIPIFLKGGIRKGTDIFKAIGRGATAVVIDKPLKWGDLHDGVAGVEKVLEILEDEFERTMYLSGCANVKEIVPSMVVNEKYFWMPNGTVSKL